MNKQFCQMGANLAEKLKPATAGFAEYLPFPNPNHERLILHPTNEAEELDPSKSCGFYDISPKIIKWSATVLYLLQYLQNYLTCVY